MDHAAGSVLYLVLVALLALGVPTATRDTAVSIGGVLALLYLHPFRAQLLSEPLRRHIQRVTPMTAGLAIQATTNLRSLPIAPWAGLGVRVAWTTTALLLGGSRSCWRRSRGLARPRATTQAGWPVIRERVRDRALPRSDVIREPALLAGTFFARRRLKG